LPPIISAQGLSKRYGSAPLFQNVSFTLSEGDRIGLIGPNGSGKSTLIEILSGRVDPDTGDVAVRKGLRLVSVAQVSEFALGATILSVIEAALERAGVPVAEHAARTAETLGRSGFDDFYAETATLSGGWRKRLAIAEALVQEPDVLLLDEPTNHLDLAGIVWLEALLLNAPFACVVVSHDRYFLENVATDMVELNRVYADGVLRVQGNYSTFLEAKEAHLHAQQKHQDALENRVRTEIEWLRRGPKARTTKSKARIDKAHGMIGELADINMRTRTVSAQIDFSATERQTKQLVELDAVTYRIDDRSLFEKLTFTVTAGMRVGLVGPNGSGKTTLLRLLRGEIQPAAGAIRKAESLRIVYFDQNRVLDPDLTLKRALAPDSDSVIYRDRVIHVAAWAVKFLFEPDNLNQPVGRLSGGERARVLIAQLMLQPADLLLLDEPTNDLDIPTLEILEESLLEFPGALVLVTHDRYMLDRVSTNVLGLDGTGGAERCADYSQWEAWQRSRLKKARQASRESQTYVSAVQGSSKREVSPQEKSTHARNVQESASQISAGQGKQSTTSRELDAGRPAPISVSDASAPNAVKSAPAHAKKKLSYNETRELSTIEARIAEAEEDLRARQNEMGDPAVMSDAARLRKVCVQVEAAQKAVEDLYARWATLEKRRAEAG
jgi:ABC transport system ATP-binding/permease protein